MTRVFVRDLEFEAGRPLWAEISLLVDEVAHETDRLEDTVDYREVKAVVAAVALNDGYRTMEKLARQLCVTLLMRFPHARRVDLKVWDAQCAGVETFIERSR